MPDTFNRLNTALAARYKIGRELGAGGMATVYLAEDLKHHRQVAVKVLQPELAAILGAERFLKEIEVTASLQHPHVLQLYDSGEADSFVYYVMPYVEGESLREKLNREKQLGVDEAIEIAKGVAAALDYAHRHSVIHRDIKPENILLNEGQPLVADFGIALAISAAGGTRLTETGLSLGTPQYMSPEQATGDQSLTARSDVYSMGAVVYELLVGDPPHTGSTVQAIISKVVSAEPQPISEVRRTIPPNVDAAVAKALAKIPADRFRTAGEFSEALLNPAFTVSTAGTAKEPAGSLWNGLSVGLAALATVTTLLFIWALLRPVPTKPDLRYSMSLPSGEEMLTTRGVAGAGPQFALSSDGDNLVYLGPGERDPQLWLRERDQLHAIPLTGTDGAYASMVFAPDGQSVAFFTPSTASALRRTGWGATLKVVSTLGGSPITLADSGVQVTLGDWHPNGYLYSGGFDGLRRIPEQGGVPEVVTSTNSAQGEQGHGWPDALPNGKGALFTIRRDPADESDIAVVRFATGDVELLVKGTYARYAASGHLVFTTADSTVLAAPFDQDRFELTGPAVAIIQQVRLGQWFQPFLAMSEEGRLVYQTAGNASGLVEPVWVDRSGRATEIDRGWRIDGFNPSLALSPDGTQLVISVLSTTRRTSDPHIPTGEEDLWIKQLVEGPLNKLTFDGGSRPNWTPDGSSVAFISDRAGQFDLYTRRADGTDTVELLWDDERPIYEATFSPDGSWLVYRVDARRRDADIYAVRPAIDTVGRAIVATEFTEWMPSLSPDGRWLAYTSNESGRFEVYVVAFPDADVKRQVSLEGGSEPVWAHNGHELFYRNGANELVAVHFRTQPIFSPGQQRVLFSLDDYLGSPRNTLYDVSPNDQRFVMLRRMPGRQGELIVLENWFEELKAKVRN